MGKKFQGGRILHNFVDDKWSSLLFPHKEGSLLPHKSYNAQTPFSLPLLEQKACWAEKRKPFITGNVPVPLLESRKRPCAGWLRVSGRPALCTVSHGDTVSTWPLGGCSFLNEVFCEGIWLTRDFFFPFFFQMWQFQGCMLINFFLFQKQSQGKSGS